MTETNAHIRHVTAAATAALMWALGASPALASDPIGSVSRLQGFATGTVAGATDVLEIDESVIQNEIVSTGDEARLEVTFGDGTQLTLGEQAVMTLDTFVYDPGQAAGELKFGVVGAFRFVSGQATKLASTDVTVTTPVATIGIRGTEFWGGPIDGEFGVFLLEGSVTVSNAAGEVTLDQPGQGTNIAAPDAAPGAVTFWPQDKVDRAVATVAFQ